MMKWLVRVGFNLLLFGWLPRCSASPNVTEELTKLKEEHYEGKGSVYSEDLAEANKFLHQFDNKADDLMNRNALTNWAYETDLSEKNLQKTIDIGVEVSDFFLNASESAAQIKTLDLPTRIARQISWIRRSADPTSDEMRREIKETIGKMTSIFGKGKVKRKSKSYTLTELTDILRTSKKRSELDWAWKSWREEVGPPIKALYGNLIDLLNIGAREHGWIDYGNYLRSDYEMGDDFELSLDKVWSDIEPLYQELHAYVRFKLSKTHKLKKDACIPANLMGDMFAQNWENIFHQVKPSKDSRTFDVTKELKKKEYTVKKMFKSAENFFVSIGLFKMPASFWKKSVLTKVKNKEMICHASAWDVSATDVRIKMCTKVRQSDFTTVHHEMGHVEYYLAYKDQPSTFRAGANPGFHEAIGDTISLSVESPSYLDDVGLLKKSKLDKDDAISFLLNQALRRVAPIPYNLLVDKWRWRVYEGNITENTYNKEWWRLRVKYQGVEPPVTRPDTSFDPASKYHIGANSPYISYFVSYVLQFQLHKAFCKEAGFKGPLHGCSIYKSQEAGKKLKKMLEAGRSEPWPKILKEATGDRELKADAILEYFEPLRTWLKEQRNTKKYPIGWKDKMSTQVRETKLGAGKRSLGTPNKSSLNDRQKEKESYLREIDRILMYLRKTGSLFQKNVKGVKKSEVLQKRMKTYESASGRSGILKTNSGDVSLSINIPNNALNELLVGKSTTTGDTKETIKNEGSVKDDSSKDDASSKGGTKGIDLVKLLTSGNPVSIKSVETSTLGENGNKEKSVKEIAIDTSGAKDKEGAKSEEMNPEKQKEALIESLVSALRVGILNSTQHTENGVKHPNIPLAATEHPVSKQPIEAANQKISTQPSEAVNHPTSTQPVHAANMIIEAKGNPESAGIAAETKNPESAGITQAPKSNYVPSNQIALLPISIPNSLLTQIQGALNASAVNKTGPPSLDFASLLGNTSLSSVTEATSKQPKEEASLLTKNETSSTSNKTAASHHAIDTEQARNDSQLVETASSSAQKSDSNETVTIPHSSEDAALSGSPVTQKQTVTACKRGGPCYTSRVVTEGTSMQAVDDVKKKNQSSTISISPSLLIQKLMEHTAAEQSTPEPVVNIVPGQKDHGKTVEVAKEEYNALSSPKEIDINQLIKALTGITNSTKNETTTTAKSTVKDASSAEVTNAMPADNGKEGEKNIKTKKSSSKDMSISTSNCSSNQDKNGVKRGFSLNFDCPDKHKGGTLSISPSELLQKLLGPKTKVELDKKTISNTHVVKTDNGFQLNFPLNTKDKIPADFSVKMTNPQGRQQHVDVLNTPKGMVVKPLKSLQLLTPLFVPVQNKDIVELRKDG